MLSLCPRFLVLCLVLALTPGLAETAENVGHFLTSGHGAHAVEAGEDHAPAGDEHGCSGTFHLCQCHSSVPSALPRPGNGAAAKLPWRSVASAPSTHPLPPHLSRLDRPPQG